VLAEDALTTEYQLDLLSLLDQLQELVESAPRLPLSDRVVVSADWLLDLLDAIRNAIPQDVIEAERLLQDRQGVLAGAREEANRLLEQAREQSKFMLQEHHIIKAAEMRAERLVNQARREAEEITASADDYVQKLFSRCEDELDHLIGEVRKTAERCS
jgi:cell division septum initiation protein DivIVA